MGQKECDFQRSLKENFQNIEESNTRLAKIDWDKVRVDAAIAAMQGLCNSCHDSVIREMRGNSDMERSDVISYLAVRIADSLVRELRK